MSSKLTRGGLAKAKLHNLSTGKFVECMFNPHEYTLTKQNQWEANPNIGKNSPLATFKQGGAQVLKLTLHFDTLLDNSDVRQYTDELWKMMMVDERNKHEESDKGAPPEVAFEWGRLYFKAVLTSMSQKFTLFSPDGTPVRCAVDITLDQKVDVDDYKDGPLAIGSTGSAPGKEVVATQGDRLDNMLSQGGKDKPSLRDVAAANNIDNPLNIAPGKKLNI